jgi:hypothetical protein
MSIPTTTIRPGALAFATLVAALCLGAPAESAELVLLSQGLPQTAYTAGDAASGKTSGPEKAFDGSWEGANTAWCNGASYPAWLMVDLGRDCNVIKVMTFMEKPGVWYSYRIETSSDQKAWTVFADQTGNTEPSEDPAYTDMGGAIARYVRITLTNVAERQKSWFWPVILEFQVYGLALPEPAEAPAEKK